MKAFETHKPRRTIGLPLVTLLMLLTAFIGYTAGYMANSGATSQTTNTGPQRALNGDKYAKCVEEANNPFEHQLLKNSSRSEQEYNQKVEQEINNCDRYR